MLVVNGLLDDAVEELATGHHLRDQVVVLLLVEEINVLHDVRVVALGEDGDLE